MIGVSTIEWIGDSVRIIDQTKLPNKLAYINCKNVKRLWKAIKRLEIRGAPAIGIAAAFGIALGLKRTRVKDFKNFRIQFKKVADYLRSSRPTAVNLSWALERMHSVAIANKNKPVAIIKELLLKEAKEILEEDRDISIALGKNGSRLVRNNDAILTHCNAGGLATGGFGTALGVIYFSKNKKVKVYATETRPLLQGARLTTWELMQNKIDVTLICDNMAADLMKRGKIKKIFVGADRITANGDAANKIGTYNLAVLAKYHKIPFYVVAPISSFDFSLKNGRQIPIEQRDRKEITEIGKRKIAPEGVKVYNPAFDVTPNELITAIVTEKGIIRRPYKQNIKRLKK